ncbi:MAG: hypothetical protein VKJ64_15555 [Leptolyngbyaceae bacterium]|nr:hypothetical protein [Leptolyngbyaceae bacterium]
MIKQSQQFHAPLGDSGAIIPEVVSWTIGGRPSWVVRFCQGDGMVLSWANLALGLVESEAVRSRWNQTWADIPTDFMWKPVPIHPEFTQHPFFAVAVPSSFPPANATAFQTHLQRLKSDEAIALFPNLSGEAQLVVPPATGDYGHIRTFCRHAPPTLANRFWQTVGRVANQTMEQGAITWCNTHGHGVPWMHVRFDRNHKYTAFPPHGPITVASQQQWYKRIYTQVYGQTSTS